MTQTGDDKELVLGNKQLISLFFVVVALCGVFFAMGYMIGRNSGKATLAADGEPAATGGDTTSATQRQQPEPPRETASTAPEVSVPPVVDTAAAPVSDTKPAQDISPRDTPTRESASRETSARATPASASARPESQTEARGLSVPQAGASYLQVTALPRADADSVVRTLRDQNFPTILATSSKDGLYRVLVGPYRQTAQVAEAKSRLKTIGFGSAFVQKQ
jgi:cell division septation protein DedD